MADPTDRKVLIHLELSVAGDSLTGSARGDDGAARAFDGRLGLLAAIDALVARSTFENERNESP